MKQKNGHLWSGASMGEKEYKRFFILLLQSLTDKCNPSTFKSSIVTNTKSSNFPTLLSMIQMTSINLCRWKKKCYHISNRKISTRYLSHILTKCSLSMTHLTINCKHSRSHESHHHKNNAYNQFDTWKLTSNVSVCVSPSAQCRYLFNDVIYMNREFTPAQKKTFFFSLQP